jgi:hypothetical protein
VTAVNATATPNMKAISVNAVKATPAVLDQMG